MEQRKATLKQAARAALYQTLHSKHQNRKRWFVGVEAFGIAVVIALSTILQVYFEIKPPTYTLDQSTYNLIGESRDDTSQYLTDNKEQKTFKFNVPKAEDSEANQHTGRVVDAYSASLPAKASDGVSVTDKNSKITMTLVPKFRTGEGRRVDGDHIVYSMGATKLIYTLKYNGLKEDIIVPKYIKDTLDYEFDLKLPSGVEARLDDLGNIGIYSSDPTLFGEISFGSDEDRAKIDKARENGEKTNLVATIPAPIIKDSNGTEHTDKSVFVLGNKQQTQSLGSPDQKDLPTEVQQQIKTNSTQNTYDLKIESKKLKDLSYPISIDPTMQITSAGDFTGINYEAGTEMDSTNNLIKRGSLTGGAVTWSTATRALSSARRHPCLFMLNGYIYIINGRTTTTSLNSTEYTTIDSDGNITGAWSSTTAPGSFSGSCANEFGTTTYNSYLYISDETTTWYIKQNANGTLGSSWQTTSGFSGVNNVNAAHKAFAISGNFYVLGGIDTDASNISRTNVSYAPINANGTLGTFVNTSSMVQAAHMGVVGVYNGFIYYAGGYDNGGAGGLSIVQRAKINSDGTLGSWINQTGVLTTVYRYHGFGGIHQGYLYMAGGQGAGAPNNTSEYAPILADGSIGTSRVTATVPSAVFDNSASGVFYNGKLYGAGGCSTGVANCADANTHLSGIYYATIKPAGELHGFNTTNAITTARVGHATVAYNGFVYVIGGCTNVSGGSGSTTNCTTATSSIEYGTINANGTITWNGTTTGINSARWGISAVAYNGYLYVVSGCDVGTLGSCSRQNNTFWAPINATGTIGTMTTDADGFQVRSYYGLAAYNGYLYTVGGDTADNTQSTSVQKTQIQTDGSVGAWSNETSLPVATRDLQVVAYNGYLYAYISNSGLYSTAINSNGTLGASWVNQINGTTAAGNSNMIIDRGHVYVVHSTGLKVIDYGRLTTNGGVTNATGGTSTLTAAAPSPNMTNPHDWSSGVTTYNGRIYIISGCSGSTGDDCDFITASVEYTEINNGGSGGTTWSTDSTDNMGTARFYHTTVAAQGRVYIIGGCTSVAACGTNGLTSVESASVNDNGTLGIWRAETSLPASRNQQGGTVYNGYIYISGGRDSGGSGVATTYYAKINSDGTLASDPDGGGSCATTWCTQSSFSLVRVVHTVVAYNNFVYAIAGEVNAVVSATVLYASINTTDGSIGAWTSTTSTPQALYNQKSVISGGRIYVTGGTANNTTPTNQVYYAQPNSDGTITTWNTSAQRFAGARWAHAAAVLNGYLYVFGGWNGSSLVTTTEYAPILTNGELGTWQTSTVIPEARDGLSAAVWNGNIYSPGGNNSGTLRNTTHIGSLASIPRAGSFSKRYDFDAGVKPTKLITRGTKQTGAVTGLTYMNSNNAGTTFGTATSVADQGYAGANALTIALGTNVTLSRYFFLRYTIDDRLSAVFPDSGNESTITDFDVYFTANPGQRLRGGRTFTNGADRGLDAQP